MQSCGGKFGGLGGSCQGQAGRRSRKILGREIGLLKTTQRRFAYGGEGFPHAKPDVRGASLGFGELYARGIGQPCPAARTAPINSQKKLVFRHHPSPACLGTRTADNSRERVLIERVNIERPEQAR